MEWLIAAGLPIAGIVGALLGSWWGRRSSSQASIGSLLSGEIEGLWSGHRARQDAAVEVIRNLMESGVLTEQQMMQASIQLKHYAARLWALSEQERRTLEVGGTSGTKGGT
jgi:hypothetical protein